MLSKTLFTAVVLTLSSAFLVEVQASELTEKHEQIYAYRAANTPVNYSFINVGIGAKNDDDIEDEFIVGQVGGQRLLNEHIILKAGYQAEYLGNDGDTNVSYHLNRANLGVGLRLGVLKRTDIELQSHLIYNWDDGALTDSVEQRDLGGSVGIAINQGFGELSEASLGVNYKSEFEEKATEVHLSFTQYITKYVGVGWNASFSDYEDSSGDVGYVGLHAHLSWY